MKNKRVKTFLLTYLFFYICDIIGFLVFNPQWDMFTTFELVIIAGVITWIREEGYVSEITTNISCSSSNDTTNTTKN